MNWDWEKLQEKRQRQDGGPPQGPDFKDINDRLKKFKLIRPGSGGAKLIFLALVLLWAGSGIYIVEPDEVGVVQRFGAYDRITGPGPHYHMPFLWKACRRRALRKFNVSKSASVPADGGASSTREIFALCRMKP